MSTMPAQAKIVLFGIPRRAVPVLLRGGRPPPEPEPPPAAAPEPAPVPEQEAPPAPPQETPPWEEPPAAAPTPGGDALDELTEKGQQLEHFKIT